MGPCSLCYVLTKSSSNITVHLASHANFGRKANVERAMSALTYMNSGGVFAMSSLSDLVSFTGGNRWLLCCGESSVQRHTA